MRGKVRGPVDSGEGSCIGRWKGTATGTRSGLDSLQVVDETDLVAEHSTLMATMGRNRSGDVMKDVDCFDYSAAPCPTDAVADARCRQFTLDHDGSESAPQ
jgi:hypothetical protein